MTHVICLLSVNRRLDEWVSEDRVDKPFSEDEGKINLNAPELLVDGDPTDRKITRNQKRKHDEINHVQKVNNFAFHSKSLFAMDVSLSRGTSDAVLVALKMPLITS